MHRYQDLITLFNNCFLEEYNTQLVKGEDEPLYLPADETREHHTIFFAHGFFASALHECSHWLIAGEQRRKLVDFGYWYKPDGRTQSEQELFAKVEAKPQALEWILSQASRYPFRLSFDNLNNPTLDTHAFKLSVYEELKKYCEKGLSPRAEKLRQALGNFYSKSEPLKLESFNFDSLS